MNLKKPPRDASGSFWSISSRTQSTRCRRENIRGVQEIVSYVDIKVLDALS